MRPSRLALIVVLSFIAATFVPSVLIAAPPGSCQPWPQCKKSPTPSVSGRGPQATIVCPVGSFRVAPGESIQAAVNASLSVCIGSGVHQVPQPILPRTGTTLTGEYGAVLDGTEMNFPPEQFGIINAHNVNVDNVTVRNLVIRDSAQKGIHAFTDASDGWLIENNEVTGNRDGVHIGNFTTVRANYIHHNVGDPSSSVPAERGGGYGGFRQHDNLWVDNEIAFNGSEQKILGAVRVTFRGNFVHHNLADGVWYDTNNAAGSVIEDNRVEDNGRMGIDWEANTDGIIRNNIVSRSGDADIFLSVSRRAEVYSNVLTTTGNNAFWVFVDSATGLTSADHYVHDNRATLTGQRAVAMTCLNTADCFGYHTTHGYRFERNTYDVPDLAGAYWFVGNGPRTFPQWQALGFDVAGSVS
jgi:parallel beta-helix repeat protein